MNRGVLAKAFRESWPGTLLLGAGLAATEAMLAYALLKFGDQISFAWAQLPVFKHLLRSLLGAEIGGQIGPDTLVSLAWAHPVVLALTWAHAITYCTRLPAGEVDRGTIDVLLGLPVSRWGLYGSETAAWLVSGIAIMGMTAAGNTLGGLILVGHMQMDGQRLFILTTNLFCLYLVVGGVSWLASALSDRRGRAIAVGLAFVVSSFLLNYLAQLWAPAEHLSFLSILHYYTPLVILRDGIWPVHHLFVLLAAALALWAAGGIVFARRDLATL